MSRHKAKVAALHSVLNGAIRTRINYIQRKGNDRLTEIQLAHLRLKQINLLRRARP